MPIETLLIANRGEIAIRIARTAAELGIRTIAIFAKDDANSLHCRSADSAKPLAGSGIRAYLDADDIVRIANESGADAIHPGYGFLAESAEFADLCRQHDVTFVGPSPSVLERLGDKANARALAKEADVRVLPGTEAPTSLAAAEAFMRTLGDNGAIMLKAVAGGGGRGMRPVTDPANLSDAFDRASSEARAAFGNPDLYAEQLLVRPRHVEVQVFGDGTGAGVHLWERECSLQRQNQKIVEIAPAPNLPTSTRDGLLDSAVKIASAVRLDNAATMEFLVGPSNCGAATEVAFIEANARLQVEHTITEEIVGLDIVALQLGLAEGKSLADIGLASTPPPQGTAIQVRVNLEQMTPEGMARPAAGTIRSYNTPGGRGIRIDDYGYAGYETNPRYDSLIAKVIAHAPNGGLEAAATRAQHALGEFDITGVETNLSFLKSMLADTDVHAGRVHTQMVTERAADWLKEMAERAETEPARPDGQGSLSRAETVGGDVDRGDPLAVLNYGRPSLDGPTLRRSLPRQPAQSPPKTTADFETPDGARAIIAAMHGTVVSIAVVAGETVHRGQQLLIMEAMKMEHVVSADVSGRVCEIRVAPGDTVLEGSALAFIEEMDLAESDTALDEEIDLDEIRPDLAEVLARLAKTKDDHRPDAVARRRKTAQRTVRENVDDLVDAGSFVEYGALTLAARRLRMSMEELIDRTPADGLVCGLGRVNGAHFDDETARTMIVAYDYTVLAGTQGKKNHQKKDRMFELAHDWGTPLILFAEGGGGRPGDTDVLFGANLQTDAFHRFAKLSGLVPLIGIVSGRCFAGNAVLAGCCDVLIATANATIGMGGPAMIEGGGLGVFRPEEVGPLSVQAANGVVDIAVKDEAEAVRVARQYLSYFQGTLKDWSCPDQRLLRSAIPENRLRVYDVRHVIETLADDKSQLELRAGWGHGMITSFIRIEGRPIGVIANNPMHLGGAIDSDASDKAARFVQLCDAFDIPILSLCDTPGNMVGPEHERTALVRHCCRMYVTAANITVPIITVILRKGYGLGAQAMAGGGFLAPLMTISWPTGEFGGMGLEGAVKLGYRDELAAIEDPRERRAAYEERVAGMYEQGKALSLASFFEIDSVIDPADTRHWIMSALRSIPAPERRKGKKRNNIDTW